jgi:DASH complex subunit DAD1
MLKPDEDRSFFNRERDKLAAEIATVRAFVFPALAHAPRSATTTACPCFTITHIFTIRPLCWFPQGFEELLSNSNVLNRKLEEVLGMTREYDTIAGLWGRFHELMKGQEDVVSSEEQPLGLPGTGGHVVSSKQGGSGK